MKLHELNALPEAKSRKRVGRGPGSGMGKTSTRGKRDKSLVVVHQLLHGSKVVKHNYIEDYLNVDLVMLNLQLDMLLLT